MLAASVVLLTSLLGVAPRAAGWRSAAQHEAAAAAGAAGARAAREACARQALWAPLGPFYFFQKPFTLEECRVAGVSAADPDVAGEWRLLRVPNVVLTPGGTAKFVMPKQALPRGAPVLQFANGLAFPSVGGGDSTFGASDNAGGDEYYTEPLGLAQGMHLHHSRTIACAALRRDERAWQALASAFGSDGLLATEQRIRCGGYHTVSDWECGEGDVDGACTEDRFAYLHFVLPPGYGDYSGDWLGSFMVDVHLEDLREGGGNRSVDVVQQFFLADPAAAKAHGLRQTYIAVHGFRPDYRDSAVAKTRASSRARSSLEVSAQTRSTGRRKLAGPNLTYRVKSSNRTSLYWTSFRFARDGRIVTVCFHAHTNTDTTLLFQATPHQLGLLKAKAASWYDFDGEYGGADRAVLAPGDGSVASASASDRGSPSPGTWAGRARCQHVARTPERVAVRIHPSRFRHRRAVALQP